MCIYRVLIIVSVSLSMGIVSEALMLRNCSLDHLRKCVWLCVSVRLSGKCIVAKWLNGSRCRLNVVSGVGRGMGVLDGGGDRWREGAVLEGEFGASHCNQWDLCDTLFLFVLMIVFLFLCTVLMLSIIFFYPHLYFALLPQRRNKVCIKTDCWY